VRQQDKADKKAKESLQLSIYAMAYKAIFGLVPNFVELYYLETGIVGRSDVPEKRLVKTEEKILTAAQGIRARNYDPKPSYMACEYCPYNLVCPATVAK
jgi:DNA helicase-2/ATP-dependent DNA helicase PcrA